MARDEGAGADILQPDGVDHAGLGFPDSRRLVAVHRLPGEPFDDDGADILQIDDGSELDGVGECAGGGDDGVA